MGNTIMTMIAISAIARRTVGWKIARIVMTPLHPVQ